MSGLRLTITERAYELARDGGESTGEQIVLRLQREGYLDVSHGLSSPLLRKQLRELVRSRRNSAEAMK